MFKDFDHVLAADLYYIVGLSVGHNHLSASFRLDILNHSMSGQAFLSVG